MNLNWGTWLYGAIMAIIVGAFTGLTAWATLPAAVTTQQIIAICVVPALGGFIAWLRQSPPPIAGK